jgi:hypothetical protein
MLCREVLTTSTSSALAATVGGESTSASHTPTDIPTAPHRTLGKGVEVCRQHNLKTSLLRKLGQDLVVDVRTLTVKRFERIEPRVAGERVSDHLRKLGDV